MDDLLRQVIHVYVEETREQVDRIAAALLTMEGDASKIPTEIEELYRQAHSLKGSSGSLGIVDLEQLAHWLESALTPVRRAQAPLSAQLVDLCLQAIMAVRDRIPGLLADSPAGSEAVASAIVALQHAAGAPAGGAHGSEPDRAPTHRLDTPGADESGPPIAASSSSAVGAHGGTDARPRPTAGPERASPIPDTSSDAMGADSVDAVRVSIDRLISFERRSDELRALRGRLERHVSEVSQSSLALDALVRDLAEKEGATVERSQLRDELQGVLRTLRMVRRELSEDTESLHATTSELDDNLRTMRLVPAALLVQPLALALREACRQTGHEATLQTVGDQVHLDRLLLEELKNPLVHVVRNAVDHGIESPEVREAIGKPSRGRVQLFIEQIGGEIAITIRDDGRGIDLQAVRNKAVERGLVHESEVDKLTEQQTYDLLFLPGFSTSETVTTLSGRGVGLDVVKTAVVRLHGQLEVESAPGSGTMLRIRVPMTMVASSLMLIADRDWTFALPQASVARVVLVRREQLLNVGGHQILRLDGEAVKVTRLLKLVGVAEPPLLLPAMPVLILRGAGMPMGILCEKTLGESDLILRALPPELQGHRPLSAVALLANGSAVFVLSAQALLDLSHALHEPVSAPAASPRQGTVLVADDSITTRSLLRSLLEVSGYLVRTVSDGDEALRLIGSEVISLIVSDVRMPRLDGLTLVSRLRADPRTAAIPIVLFSSSDSEEDKQAGLASGANAYLSKGAFDRGQLIDVVRELLRGAA